MTKMNRAVSLHQHLYDLRERERLAKLHNRELLQQFEEAQVTLREMLDRTAAMKMLRKEYECYFWSCSNQDNQFLLKAQTTPQNVCTVPGGHQTCPKISERSKCNNPQFLQGPGKMPITTGAYQGVAFPLELFPSLPISAPTQPTVISMKTSEQLWDITQSSPSSFPQSYLVGSHQLPCTLSVQPSASPQTSPFTNHPGLSDYNTSDKHDTHHFSPQSQKDTPKRPPSSTSVISGENISHSEDLDVKPVRLSSRQGHKDSSQTSSQGSAYNKSYKSNQSSSSDENQCSTHKSSPLRAVASGLTAMTIHSENDDSETSSQLTSKQNNGLGLKRSSNTSEDSSSDNESESDTEDCHGNKILESAQVTPERAGITLENIATPGETERICNQSSLEDEDENSEKEKTFAGRKLTSHENDIEEKISFPRCSSEEEADDETYESEDEQENTEESASLDGEADEDNMEEPESEKDNEHKDTTKKREDSDSEECIVSPQTRSKIIYVIPEHTSEHQETSSRKTVSSDDDRVSSGLSNDDIEKFLAPQGHTLKLKEQPADEKPNDTCDTAGRFCVKEEQVDRQSDSNDSDDFYD